MASNTLTDKGEHGASIDADICIVGAGIAGVNALYIATEYLPRDARVVLVDRNAEPGGMWTDTYDYVRLQQPHVSFTAADVDWTLGQPQHYLATGAEVQAHLAYCVRLAAERVHLRCLYGHTFEYVTVAEGGRLRLDCRDADGNAVTVNAERMVNAIAMNIRPADPLTLSSGSVLSTTPEALKAEGTLESDAPVIVVGGGKTGVDTVLALAAANPDRHITVVRGKGTMFANRDKILPKGIERWWSGLRIHGILRDIATRFDGENEAEVLEHSRTHYFIDPHANSQNFLFGLLSEGEVDRFSAGVSKDIAEYLVDVEDSQSGPVMRFRSGATHPLQPGSVVINCSGHLHRGNTPVTPIVSDDGRILSINQRDSIYFLTSIAAYIGTHMWFRGNLRDAPFYAIDMETLFQKDRTVWAAAMATQAFYNQVAFLAHAPFSVVDRCGLDLDRWFPLPRRLFGVLDIKLNQRRFTTHCRKSLDRVCDRFDIHGGLLNARVGGDVLRADR